MAADWDPDQYQRFAAQRAQPFWDLAALLDTDDAIDELVDLGCGTGDLTAALAAHLGVGSAVGVDSSPAMLERAAVHRSERVRFEPGDIGAWCAPGGVDVVFANASLQWVPDHRAVLERWTDSLRAGGRLAVQVPANADHPSHLASVEAARTAPFLDALGGDPPPDPVAANVRTPEWYATVLHELGFAEQSVRLQVYAHVLASSTEVIEWVRGTSLRRFFDRLPAELHEPFVDAYRRRLLDMIGDRRPYLYPFKRILIWGRLPTHRTRGGAIE
jgi:trans-aconitate 2-methyltransferase